MKRFVRITGVVFLLVGVVQSGWNFGHGDLFASADQFSRFWFGLTAILVGATLMYHERATLGLAAHARSTQEMWVIRLIFIFLTYLMSRFFHWLAQWTFQTQYPAVVGFASVLGVVVVGATLCALTYLMTTLFECE